jgi:hypothetical protein
MGGANHWLFGLFLDVGIRGLAAFMGKDNLHIWVRPVFGA